MRRVEYFEFSPVRIFEISYKSIDGYESCVTYLKNNYPFVPITVPYLSDVFLDGEENEYLTQGKERLKTLKEKFKAESQQHFNVILQRIILYMLQKKAKGIP